MNKEYILMDLDKLKLITEDLITDVAWPYKLKKIEDLTLSNLFKLKINRCDRFNIINCGSSYISIA